MTKTTRKWIPCSFYFPMADKHVNVEPVELLSPLSWLLYYGTVYFATIVSACISSCLITYI